jgi:hypothetical protein
MRAYVITMVALLAFDLCVKMWRLYSENTSYPGWAAVVDGLLAAALAAWGIWVLASASA